MTIEGMIITLYETVTDIKQQLKLFKKNLDSEANQNNSSLQILSKYQPQLLIHELEKHSENVIDNSLFRTSSGKSILEALNKLLIK